MEKDRKTLGSWWSEDTSMWRRQGWSMLPGRRQGGRHLLLAASFMLFFSEPTLPPCSGSRTVGDRRRHKLNWPWPRQAALCICQPDGPPRCLSGDGRQPHHSSQREPPARPSGLASAPMSAAQSPQAAARPVTCRTSTAHITISLGQANAWTRVSKPPVQTKLARGAGCSVANLPSLMLPPDKGLRSYCSCIKDRSIELAFGGWHQVGGCEEAIALWDYWARRKDSLGSY